MSVKQKMTALADEVRTLSGTTESKTVDDMTSDVGDANEVITEQALLISSIKSVVDNLPNAIPEDQYKDSADLVVDGAKVITPAGFYPSDAEKSVKTTNVTPPTFTIRADEEESEIVVRASNIQSEGYVPTTTRYDDAFVALTIEGDTATMSCGGQSIVRKMEGGGGSDLVDAIISGTAETLDSNTESVHNYAFHSSAIKNANFPNVKNIGDYAFFETPLESIFAPNVETVGKNAFASTQLVNVLFPKLQGISNYCFYKCASIKKVDLASASNIGTYAFLSVSTLEAVILRRTDQVATIASSSGLPSSTYVYVPRVLLSSYKSATNWSKIASQIRAIEDYPEITGG